MNLEFELPLCTIPLELLENYQERVKRFYQDLRQGDVEREQRHVEKATGVQIHNLVWNEKGLHNISFIEGGLDLDLDHERYVFHNIEWSPEQEPPLEATALFNIAKKYLEILAEY